MDYTYLKNNTFKYAHLSKPGTFVQNNGEVVPLEFPGAGTYYLFKENNQVNLLSLAANSSSASFTIADGKSQTLFNASAVNLIYTIDVVGNANIIDNYNAGKVASITVTTTVDGTAKTDTRNFYSPQTVMQFFNKLEGKTTDKVEISCANCSITGSVKFTYDQIVPN